MSKATWFKRILKKEHTVMAFEPGEDGHILFGYSDENTDANILDEFMSRLTDKYGAWHDLSYIRIDKCWTLFNRWSVFHRDVFVHDLMED